MPKAYYNEIDPFAAAWLRELIKAGHIAAGEVDERSIEDVTPGDLTGFTQCHFFAGIGVWSYALRQAGWPDSRPVWTGSCPCQPFSQAGKRKGFADERHLWPAFFWLIQKCSPVVIFGEQVASKDGLAWLDIVQADLEATGYTTAAIDFCSAGVGAPHIRQRLYWVGHAPWRQECWIWQRGQAKSDTRQTGGLDTTHRLADTNRPQNDQEQRQPATDERRRTAGLYCGRRTSCGVGNTFCDGEADCRPGPTNGFWRNPDWLFCRDGKWRPVVATHVALADGASSNLVRMCDKSPDKKEEMTHENLRLLWQGTDTKKVLKRSIGVPEHVKEAKVLQQKMYGRTYEKRNMCECQPQQNESFAPVEEEMRTVWEDREITRSSCERESSRQHPVELEDVVSLLSSSMSLAKLYGDRRTEEALQALRQTIYEEGTMLYASYPLEKVWASISEKAKDRIRMDFDASRWKKLVAFPLEHNAVNRTGRLRGYGNAINAETAKAFIEAFMMVRPCQ